ncbi:glycosyltransferase [Candidatus Planktophila dulcis]|jgi:dolichol-phosphate mannosyltransferase|uniref:glycosyltransferase n=1 Tax=Candidatus Planktophila dulcis TaxID=1884914 RepID=UPI003BEEBC2F
MIFVDVIIPAYDELPNLRKLIPRITSVLEPGYKFKIKVIVRHHEPDEVLEEILNLGATPIRRFGQDSFGDAIRTGIASISSDSTYTVFLDADGSHDPNTIPKLIYAIDSSDADVVVASRYVKGGKTDNGLILRIMSRVLNLIFGLVLGIKVRDISTNFKIYRSEILQELELKCDKFDILEELLFAIRRKQGEIRIKEIPDHFHNRELGESKRKLGPFVIGYILTLIRLRLIKKI